MKIEHYANPLTEELMELLLTADPDRGAVVCYLEGATVFVASDQGLSIGIAVLVVADGRFELKNIAVCDSHQGQGIAKSLIAAVKNKAREFGGTTLYVGTGNSSLSQLALYQKCGFRMEYIERDFFSGYPEDIYEHGIRCMDMVVLSIEL